jgi:hypothetical protein
VGLPNEALKETDQAQGHVENRSESPSPNRKRPSTGLVESGGTGARANKGGKATATSSSSSSVEEDGGGRDEEDSKPSLVTSSAARIGSSRDQEEVVQEQATTIREIPYGWTRVKLEPDFSSYRIHIIKIVLLDIDSKCVASKIKSVFSSSITEETNKN